MNYQVIFVNSYQKIIIDWKSILENFVRFNLNQNKYHEFLDILIN